MKKGQVTLLLFAAFLLIFGTLAVQCTKMQPEQQARSRIERTITGVVAKGYRDNGYIIRSQVGTKEIFTILNPEPKILDEFVKTEKTVAIDVEVVTGDNINIIKIDGNEYP